MLEISIAISVLLCLGALLTPGKKSLLRGVHLTLILLSMVPSFAAPPTAQAVSLVCIVLALAVALVKNSQDFRMSAVNWGLVFFVVALGISGTRSLPINIAGFNVLMAAGLVLAALVFPLATKHYDVSKLMSPLAFMLPVHALLGFLEQISPRLAFWPRGTWIDDISNRSQQLVPGLFSGRSMSLAGHPITLGFLSAVGVLVALELYRRRRHSGYLVLAFFGVISVLLAGARSAAAAGLICLIVAFVAGRGRAPRTILGVTLAGLVVIGIQVNALSVFLNDSVQQTISYTHRTDVISSARQIYGNASDLERAIGVGEGNVAQVFQRSFLGMSDNYTFFDNQYVRLFAISGIVTLILVLIATLTGLIRGDRMTRLILIFTLIMFFSFDTLTWFSGAMIFTIAASGLGSREYRSLRHPQPTPALPVPATN